MNLTGLLTGIGQTGSDIAQASINAHEQRIKDLFDKLGLQQGQVNLSESQERLKRLQGEPKTEEEKIGQTISAIKKFIPNATENDIRAALGLPAAVQQAPDVATQIESGLKAIPEAQRRVVEPAIRAYMAAGHQDKALQVLSSVAEKIKPESTAMELVQPTGGGAPFALRVGERSLTPKDAEWTPQMQAFLDAGVASYQQAQKAKQAMEDRRIATRLALAKAAMQAGENQKLFNDYDKASKSMKVWNHMENLGDSADQYVNAPSGPGDAALVLAYADAVKPASGFRFTTTEQKLIIDNTRDLVAAAEAKYAAGTRGLLLGPADSEQRKQIGAIVKEAARQASQQKDDYLNGINKINPKLYEILTDTNDDLEQVQ